MLATMLVDEGVRSGRWDAMELVISLDFLTKQDRAGAASVSLRVEIWKRVCVTRQFGCSVYEVRKSN